MTKEALRLLWTLEERLVAGGSATEPADARTAELLARGLVDSPAPDSWTLTPKGWCVAAALRRYRAENAVRLQVGDRSEISADLAAFIEPPDEAERAEARDLATETFVRAMAADPAADPTVVAQKAFDAAAAFIAKRKAVQP